MLSSTLASNSVRRQTPIPRMTDGSSTVFLVFEPMALSPLRDRVVVTFGRCDRMPYTQDGLCPHYIAFRTLDEDTGIGESTHSCDSDHVALTGDRDQYLKRSIRHLIMSLSDGFAKQTHQLNHRWRSSANACPSASSPTLALPEADLRVVALHCPLLLSQPAINS